MTIIVNRVDQGIALKNSSPFAISSGIISPELKWDTATYDSNNVWNPSTPERITIPEWAKYVKVIGHVVFPSNVPLSVPGTIGVHLFRNGDPTFDDLYYHTRTFHPFNLVSNNTYLTCIAETPWIPVLFVPEWWSMCVFQSSGQTINTYAGFDPNAANETWLAVNFTQSVITA